MSILVDKIVATEKRTLDEIFSDKSKIYTFLNPVSYLTALDHRELFEHLKYFFL